MIIDYNQKAKKFEIKCDFAENSLLSDMPNRRFQRRRQLWQAPALSANAKFILDRFAEECTPAALEAAKESLQRTEIRRTPFPAWYPFKTKPFDHQYRALDYCWGLREYALFMEMGTGKSKTAIDLNIASIMAGNAQVWVVFCPNAIRDNWTGEVSVHSPVDIPVHIVGDLTAAKKRRLLAVTDTSDPYILVVGIESLQQKYQGGSAFDILVQCLAGRKYLATVDESHLIKGHDANRSRNVEFLCQNAAKVGIMTGTPIAQGIMDLYQQFQTLDPDIVGVGNFYSFRNRYAEMGGYEKREVIGYKNVEELMGLLNPYVFQCTKADTLDLPDKLYTRRVVQMSKDQAKAYKELDKQLESTISDLSRKGISIELVVDQVLAKYTALQQITGGFVNYNDESEEEVVRRSAWLVKPENNPKTRELMAIADENPGKPIIVWARFKNEIAIIAEALEARYGAGSVSEYHGGFSKDERKENMRRFKAGESKFFVANQMTGGTGLTINEANLVVYWSNTLKLVERLQSEDRNHRIGQKNDVTYIDLVCAGTKDVEVLRAIREKKNIAEYVRESMQAKA